MSLTKLSISPCTVDDKGNITVKSNKFEVMLNPSSYSHNFTIIYNKKTGFGATGSSLKFSNAEPETVSFDIVLDGTGLVEMTNGAKDVKTQIQKLNDIVYKYDGKVHEPDHVRLLWGSFIFFGRLNTLSTDYSLFMPTGEPLRAKLKMSFSGFVSKNEEALIANRSSPDLTHIIEVKAGDSLPLLCYRIYGDSSYYQKVAQFNGISNFRDIKPGARLNFPPLG